MLVQVRKITKRCLRGWLVGLTLGMFIAGGAMSGLIAQAAFFSTVEDLPLMSGLLEIADEGMVFDKPEGRIVEVVAAGTVLHGAVVAYYESTLPELGWHRKGAAEFVRSGEVLRYRLETVGGMTEIRFTIAPN